MLRKKIIFVNGDDYGGHSWYFTLKCLCFVPGWYTVAEEFEKQAVLLLFQWEHDDVRRDGRVRLKNRQTSASFPIRPGALSLYSLTREERKDAKRDRDIRDCGTI